MADLEAGIDAVLAARERLGKKLAETLIREQEEAGVPKTPISPASGKPLQRKDKKDGGPNTLSTTTVSSLKKHAPRL